MVFIKRDAQNRICALCQKDSEANLEEIADDHPELIAFLMLNGLDQSQKFLKSDLEMIRVIDDIIVILLKKNYISITDFPTPVIEKLVSRNKIRGEFQNIPINMDED